MLYVGAVALALGFLQVGSLRLEEGVSVRAAHLLQLRIGQSQLRLQVLRPHPCGQEEILAWLVPLARLAYFQVRQGDQVDALRGGVSCARRKFIAGAIFLDQVAQILLLLRLEGQLGQIWE